MDQQERTKIATLFELHEEICKEIAQEEMRKPNNGPDYIRGLKEARNLIEAQIEQMVE